MVDRDNLPRPAPELSEAGVPAIDEIPAEVLATGDQLEGELPPLDRPQAATSWGTTASEQLAPEPLDIRLAREMPEVDTGEFLVSRQLIEPGADGGLGDDEADMLGEIDAGFEDTLSAEEAAVQIVDEPPGLNYDPDPGYIDREGSVDQ
jgi:hypothetical protein